MKKLTTLEAELRNEEDKSQSMHEAKLAEASGLKNLYILRGIDPKDGEIKEFSFCASHYEHAINLAIEGKYLLKPEVVEGIQGGTYTKNRPYGLLK